MKRIFSQLQKEQTQSTIVVTLMVAAIITLMVIFY
jgi:hypothetical protein